MRYAFRSLASAPLFTCSAVLALALGIGANTAVFSVIHTVLLTPLPFNDPERLVRLWEAKPSQGVNDGGMSPGTFVDVRQRMQTLESSAILVTPREWLYRFVDDFELLRQPTVSPDMFRLLGVAPVAGRTFRPEVDQPPPFGDAGEIVIGYRLWQRRFGGRPEVVGATLVTEAGRQLRIIGVMPPHFDFPDGAQIWSQETSLRPVGANQRQVRYYEAVARVRTGVSLEQVEAELAAIGEQLALEHPQASAGWSCARNR